MTPLIIGATLASAGPCGELIEAERVDIAVNRLQRQHMFVTYEGPWMAARLSFRVADDDTASEALGNVLAACGTSCADYRSITLADRVDLRFGAADSPRLLDTRIVVAPGETALTDLAEQLGGLLSTPSIAPIVRSAGYVGRRVIVPDIGPAAARDLLAALVVVPANPVREGQTPSQERVGWLELHGGPGEPQAVLLTIVDVSRLEGRSGSARERAELVGVVGAMLTDSPPPGFDSASLDRMAAENAAALEGATALDARSAVDCDP